MCWYTHMLTHKCKRSSVAILANHWIEIGNYVYSSRFDLQLTHISQYPKLRAMAIKFIFASPQFLTINIYLNSDTSVRYSIFCIPSFECYWYANIGYALCTIPGTLSMWNSAHWNQKSIGNFEFSSRQNIQIFCCIFWKRKRSKIIRNLFWDWPHVRSNLFFHWQNHFWR